VFVVSRPGDRGGLLACQHDDTDEKLLMGKYGRGLLYDLMTFDERDQVDAERTDAIRRTVSSPARAARYPTLRSPPTVKIIDRVKTYIQQKKGRDPHATDSPLEGATAEPEPATEAAAEPATEAAAEPTTEAAVEPATEAATEPAAEVATEPAAEPAAEPATEAPAEPATEATTAPAACPRCGATGDAPCTTPSGKATKTHKGREQ
jgi:hypothetical protein